MITAYHRPHTLEEALSLLSRAEPVTLALGGGTSLASHRGEDVEVVDLQDLPLSQISGHGKNLVVGATVSLQQIRESAECPKALASALRIEAPLNLRYAASVAGTLVECDGRSGFAAVLLALDSKIALILPQAEALGLGEFLALRDRYRRGCLITKVELPRAVPVEFDYVSRTPADKPIVAVALAKWPSGRTRLVVAGSGSSPQLAMDGVEADDLQAAARNALHDASDPWASAEYRMDAAATLVRRCLSRIDA